MQQRLKFKLSEAEQVFYSDIREKKKAASGVHSKTGKNGYVGNMRFSYDIMTRKEKYNHRKAGKVMTTNIYDEILTMDEFEKLETFEQKNRLAYWRNKYSNKEITQGLGIWNNKYYSLVAELELPKAPRKRSEPRKSKPIKVQEELKLEDSSFKKLQEDYAALKMQNEMLLAEKKELEAPIQEIMVDGLHLVFNGTYTPEQIQRQLSKFELLLEGEKDTYYIELKLMQKKQQEKEYEHEIG